MRLYFESFVLSVLFWLYFLYGIVDSDFYSRESELVIAISFGYYNDT